MKKFLLMLLLTLTAGAETIPLKQGNNVVGIPFANLQTFVAPTGVFARTWDPTTNSLASPFNITTSNAAHGTQIVFLNGVPAGGGTLTLTGDQTGLTNQVACLGAPPPATQFFNYVSVPGAALGSSIPFSQCTITVQGGSTQSLTNGALAAFGGAAFAWNLTTQKYDVVDLTSPSGSFVSGTGYVFSSGAKGFTLGTGPGASPTPVGSPSPGPLPTPSPSPQPSSVVVNQGVVSGHLLNYSNGTNLDGVNATVDGRGALTNDQGFFSLNNVTPGDSKLVTFTKSGFAPTSRVVKVVAGDTAFINGYLAPVGTTQTVSGSTGGNATEPAGSTVTLPANGVVTASGTPYTGTVNVSITTLRAGNSTYLQTFPGLFVGTTPSGDQDLLSFGVVTVNLSDSNGNPLNLASGKNATVRIPIDSSNDPGNSTIPFWTLNPSTGKWTQDGTATRSADNLYYQLTVSHFSTINLDFTFSNGANKDVTVTDSAGLPVPYAHVFVKCKNIMKDGYTDNLGVCHIIRIQPSVQIQVWAEKGTVRSQTITEMAPAAGVTLQNTLVLDNPVATITLTWGKDPSDLDSHLTGPTAGGNFHVYYDNKGSLNSSPYAKLDTDDTTGFGPEIITISRWIPGTYHYYVNLFAGTGSLQTSALVVDLILPGQGSRRYTAPANPTNSNVLKVFDINVSSGGNVTVSDINSYTTNITRSAQTSTKQ